jgi:Rrf2 family protein
MAGRRAELMIATEPKAELVQATRGAHGGYVLARPAEEITMDDVVLALEGAIAPMDCFVDDRDHRVSCSHLSDGEHCATKLLWTRVQMGVIKSLQRTTLQELVDFASPQHTLEIHG